MFKPLEITGTLKRTPAFRICQTETFKHLMTEGYGDRSTCSVEALAQTLDEYGIKYVDHREMTEEQSTVCDSNDTANTFEPVAEPGAVRPCLGGVDPLALVKAAKVIRALPNYGKKGGRTLQELYDALGSRWGVTPDYLRTLESTTRNTPPAPVKTDILVAAGILPAIAG